MFYFPFFNSPDRVDARLDQNPLLLIPGDHDGVEKELLGLADLYLRLVVPLHLLAGEILEAHRGLQSPLNTEQVRLQGGGLKKCFDLVTFKK